MEHGCRFVTIDTTYWGMYWDTHADNFKTLKDGYGANLDGAYSALLDDLKKREGLGRTLVLLISDGLDTGESELLDRELAWLTHRCRRLLWLNPLLRFEGYAPLARGAAVLHRHAHGMLAVHNLARLQDLAASLAALLEK